MVKETIYPTSPTVNENQIAGSAARGNGHAETRREGGTQLYPQIVSDIDKTAQIRLDEEAVAEEWHEGDVILDLYEVRRKLGQGGFGRVYLVRHKSWNVELAVKTPLIDKFDETRKEDFRREAETWVNLGVHPHIITCYYVRDLGGIPRVFAEFAKEGSLSDWIRTGKLYQGGQEEMLERLLDVAIQFAWGLQYAHQQGLVHQDVKPSNVLMTEEGVAKVTDFGLTTKHASIVLQVKGSDETPADLNRAMTREYCSPEQAQGLEMSVQSDIWSWGLSVLEMFAGGLFWMDGQFGHQILEEYLGGITTDSPLPEMPPKITQLLRDCLNPLPASRPANMELIIGLLTKVFNERFEREYPRSIPKAAVGSADSLNNRALSYLDLGKVDDAVQTWKEILDKYAAHEQSVCNLSLLQWRRGEIAVNSFKERVASAVSLSGNKSLAENWLPLAEIEAGEFDNSLPQVEGALSQDPELIELRKAVDMVASGDITANKPIGLLNERQSDSRSLQHLKLTANQTVSFVNYWSRLLGYFLSAQKQLGGVTRVSARHADRFVLFSNEKKREHLIQDTTGSVDSRLLKIGPLDHFLTSWLTQIYSKSGWGQLFRGLRATKKLILSSMPFGLLVEWGFLIFVLVIAFLVLSIVYDVVIAGLVFFVLVGARVFYFMGKDRLRIWYIDKRSHAALTDTGCINPEGTQMLSWCSDREMNFEALKYWSISTGENVCYLQERDGEATNFFLNTTAEDRKPTGLVERVFPVNNMWKYTSGVDDFLSFKSIQTQYVSSAMVIDTVKGLALVGCSDGTIRVYSLETGHLIRDMRGHTGAISCICLSPDGRLVMSGSEDSTVNIWDVTTGTCLQTLRGHKGTVTSVSLNSEKGFGFSGGADQQVLLWDLTTSRCLRSYAGHASEVIAIDYCWEANIAASLGRDNQIYFWEYPDSVKEIAPYRVSQIQDSGILIDAENKFELLVSDAEALIESSNHNKALSQLSAARHVSGYERSTRVLDLIESLYVHTQRSGVSSVWLSRVLSQSGGVTSSICYSRDGQFVLSGHLGDDENRTSSIRMWNCSDGTTIHNFKFGTPVTGLSLNYDGDVAVTATSDGEVILWDTRLGRSIRSFYTLDGESTGTGAKCVSLAGDARLAASGGDIFRLWDTQNGVCIEEHARLVTSQFIESVALDPFGAFALTGHRSGMIRLWNLPGSRTGRELKGHRGAIYSLRVSPDRRTAISCSEDNDIRVWNLQDGVCRSILVGHECPVRALDISADGNYIVSGGSDGIVKVWELATGKCLITSKCHDGPVTALGFSPTSRYFCSGGTDGTLSLWELDWDLAVKN